MSMLIFVPSIGNGIEVQAFRRVFEVNMHVHRDKNIIGMYRRRGSNPPLLCGPGWVV